ncbi:MAG: SMC-Scp complex subunit ScpB [Thermoguttaceae bacterium]|nr:SMC-Scp complex subunit ScpB [Thermoguttaceae bacterium]
MRSIFDAESEDDEDGAETSEDGDASEAERFQRDFERERRESLDGVLLQNDADFLREAGEKYERSRVSDADFERRNVSRSGASGASNGQNGRIGQGEQNRKGGQNGVIGEKGEDVGSANVGEFGETSVEATGGRRVPIGPASILEAMLFVGDRENRPLTLARATELMRNVSETEALEALADLNERYWRDGAPYRIVRDGDGFRMALRPEFDALAARFVGGKTKEFKLTQTMIDVLALIAYRQPISLDEILETRNNATGALSQLVKRELVAQEKRIVDKKKVAFYSTTPRFLRLFNLESLDDLPIVGDVDYR